MTLVLNLKTKFIVFILLFCYPAAALADPEVNNELIPPGEAMYVTDTSILEKLNLGPDTEPVWCYSNLANSLIITSADREREKCELKLSQQREKLSAIYRLQIDSLEVNLVSLKTKYEEVIKIKNQEINELTSAALKRPNDYSAWWATGGFVAGVATVLSIFWATK